MENVVENTFKVATTRKFGDLDVHVYENSKKEFFMTREQIGRALEYNNPATSITMIHKRNAARLDPLSTHNKLLQVEGNRTVERNVLCYSLRGVMEICRFSTQPKANAFMDFCWDVMTALMKGEAVLANASTPGQQRFDLMNKEVLSIQKGQEELVAKMDALETARKQDRQAIDNVLFVCKQLAQTIQTMNQTKQPGSYTPHKSEQPTTYKGRSEWRSELYNTVNMIVRLTGLTMNAVLKQGYDYIGRNYGWYFKDERKAYIKRSGYKGDPKNVSGLDVIEASDMYRSIFMSIMKDRYENEKHDAEMKKGIVSGLRKIPPVIPKEALPKRHQIEEIEPEPVVVAEAHAIEVEEPVVEVEPPKKRDNGYKPSITLPIVKPIAEKLGDKTVGCRITYAKIYNVIGIQKMDRLRKQYIRTHSRPPKCNPDLFQDSEKNMKLFREAARAVDALS